MKNWLAGNFSGRCWLSSGLLLCCINAIGIGIGLPRQVVAQTDAPRQAISLTGAEKPQNRDAPQQRTTENAATSAPTLTPADQSESPIDIATILAHSLKPPVLPPIGDATAYLPTETDALGLYLVVKLGNRRVYVYKSDQPIASYPIAVGKPGWETPVGTYKVLSMEKNPIFKSFKSGRVINPGPDNPLGVRWIGIWTDGKTQLGFHGTNQPELIGQAVSHGCIRMYNKDVVALYEQVGLGVTVKVEP